MTSITVESGKQELKTADKLPGTAEESDFSTKLKIAVISVVLGLTLNWISLFLSITLGFLSLGISVFFVLLIAKVFLGKQATRQNLALVSVAYGATMAAESSIGLLFLIWLSTNASFFGISADFPAWLLPSPEVLASRTIFSAEWLVPLAIHYFLMVIPGFAGIILGLYLKNRYLHDEEKYPFPGVVQRSQMVDVLVVNQSEKVNLFKKFLAIGFVFALVTLFFPVIDFSSPQDGWIFGLSLGVVGLALFAVGFIVGNWKITVTASISSVIVYVFLSPFLVKQPYLEAVASGLAGTGYFDFYTFALQGVFISFIIGFLLSAIILAPLTWKIGKGLVKKITGKNGMVSENSGQATRNEAGEEQETNPAGVPVDTAAVESRESFLTRLRQVKLSKKDLVFVSFYAVIYIISVAFVYFTGILGDNLLVIGLVMFWILIIGSIVLGIITTDSVSKTSAAMVPPFIFDMIPLFLAGARGFTPYIATPKAEVGETMGIVRNSKFSQKQGLSTKAMITAYLVGYLPAILTTPFFALLLWVSFGIGTSQLPAPGFPVQAMLLAPFAAGSIEAVLNLGELLLGVIVAVVAGPGMGIGLAFGMFFPPHMALAIGLGGITRVIMDKRAGKDKVRDKGMTAATALSVGASLVIPIMIIMSLLL
ncbi:MAG: hypothetical protein ACFFD4_39595 [Candidatus Odinarchaeota archaeon]